MTTHPSASEIPAEATEWGPRPLFSPAPGEAAVVATGRLDRRVSELRGAADTLDPGQ